MLPADVIAEIIANLAALNLQPSTAAAVLGALAPATADRGNATSCFRTATLSPTAIEQAAAERPAKAEI